MKKIYVILIVIVAIFIIALMTTSIIIANFPGWDYLTVFSLVFIGELVLFSCIYVVEYT